MNLPTPDEYDVRSQSDRWPEPVDDEPTFDELEDMVFDSVAAATDGCPIEPDGICEHGYPSWLLYLGYI